MNRINLHELPKVLFRDDPELTSYIHSMTDNLTDLYAGYLPSFEKFLFALPENITVEEFKALLLAQSVKVRVLIALRLNNFFERVAGKELPSYKSFKSFLVQELYENHPDKIRWSK